MQILFCSKLNSASMASSDVISDARRAFSTRQCSRMLSTDWLDPPPPPGHPGVQRPQKAAFLKVPTIDLSSQPNITVEQIQAECMRNDITLIKGAARAFGLGLPNN